MVPRNSILRRTRYSIGRKFERCTAAAPCLLHSIRKVPRRILRIESVRVSTGGSIREHPGIYWGVFERTRKILRVFEIIQVCTINIYQEHMRVSTSASIRSMGSGSNGGNGVCGGCLCMVRFVRRNDRGNKKRATVLTSFPNRGGRNTASTGSIRDTDRGHLSSNLGHLKRLQAAIRSFGRLTIRRRWTVPEFPKTM